MIYQLSLLAERDLANIAQSTREHWGDNQARQYGQLFTLRAIAVRNPRTMPAEWISHGN